MRGGGGKNNNGYAKKSSKLHRIREKVVTIASDTRKSLQNNVGYAKKSSKLHRMHEKVVKNGFLHLPKLDFHRFSLIFIEVLKIAENLEKQSFTFFAFLPPYIGVSGSLVSGMRKSVNRSIDWYQKFLISWLAAWYSTVFVFHLKCLILLFWNVVEAIAGRARANSLPHVLGLQIFLALGGGC